MKLTDEQLGGLLSLKRHEKPPEGYLDDFLREFHVRCRQESVRRDRRIAPWRRLTDWLSEPGLAKWIYGAGVAYAAAVALLVSLPLGQEVEAPVLRPADHRVAVPAEDTAPVQLEQLDLRPSSEGRPGEQEF